jgi:hypothetical protein
MYKRILTFVALAAVLLLLQCSDKPTQPEQQIKLGELFTLTPGKTLGVQGEDLSLTFRSVLSDSRCPFSVLCFWEGIAEIQVALVKTSGDTALVTLGVLGGTRYNAENPYFVDTLGYRLTLLRLDPYPEGLDKLRLTTPPQPLSEYQATLRIDHTPVVGNLTGSVAITNSPPDSILLDYFAIDSVSVVGDSLSLAVNYGGCCRNHYFFLFMSPASFFESLPAQANLYLRHFANHDMCKCRGRGNLKFDLRTIADLYIQVYGVAEPIALNISEFTNSFPDSSFRVIYYPTGAQHNRAPVLSHISPQTVTEGDTLRFAVAAVDPNGTIPTLSAIGLPSHASFVDNGDGTGEFLFVPDTSQAGEYQVTFIASDGEFADSEVVAILVEDAPLPQVNHVPVLAEIGPKSIEVGDTLRFAVSATDPDGTTPSVFAVDLPRNASLMTTDSGNAIFWFSPDTSQIGEHNILFYATDGELADSETVAITVILPNDYPPLLDSIASFCDSAGGTVSFLVSATDEDGTFPVLTATNLPEHAAFVDSGNGKGVFVFDSNTSQHGTYVVTFVASDGRFSDSEEVTVILYSQEVMSSALIPMAVGNYWTYKGVEHPYWGRCADSIQVVSASVLSGGLWWNLDSASWLGQRFHFSGDSVFNEKGLQFIPSSDTAVMYSAATGFYPYPKPEALRKVCRLADSVVVPAGTFRGCVQYSRGWSSFDGHNGYAAHEIVVIAPNVGVIVMDWGYETGPYSWVLYRERMELERYRLK